MSINRLIKLDHQHAQDQQTKANLRSDKKKLKDTIKEQKATIKELQAKVKEQAIIIAELQQAMFAKKKKPNESSQTTSPAAKKPTVKRSPESYRRSLPQPDQITDIKKLKLPNKCSCGGSLVETKISSRYLEDIPLPLVTNNYQAKIVTQYRISQGVCLMCNKKHVAKNYDLSGQKVRLGSNAKLLIVDLITQIGLSYAKTTRLLHSLYGLQVSSGEIASILQQTHLRWLPHYNDFKSQIRASPSLHMDETSWPIQSLARHGQAFVMSSTTGLTVFALRNSRQLIHIQELLNDYLGVRITDDYAAYSNKELKGDHQICWSHPYRVIRDLVYNSNLPPEQKDYVASWYQGFSEIYNDLNSYLKQSLSLDQRLQCKQELSLRLSQLINSQPDPASGEPLKLTKLKAQLNKALVNGKLFVCLEKLTNCDNNQAERELRPLVIKRKLSFGSKTQKGANALATVMSVCLNTYKQHPDTYFKALAALG